MPKFLAIHRFYEKLVLHLKEKEIPLNLGDDIDQGGVLPLPSGYRDRDRTILDDDGTVVKILDLRNFVIPKMRRRIEQCDLLKTEHQEIKIETNYSHTLTIL